MDEVHIHNAELISIAELPSELQKAEGRESCLAQSKTSILETGAVLVARLTSIKETCVLELLESKPRIVFGILAVLESCLPASFMNKSKPTEKYRAPCFANAISSTGLIVSH